jgi:hypothetical protein
MTHAEIRQVPPLVVALVGTVTAAALAIFVHGWRGDMMLDSLTGVLSISGALFVVLRLALGMDNRQGRLLWQSIFVILLFVGLGKFLEPYSIKVGDHLRIDDIDHLLLLAVGPIALRFNSNFEHIPLWARNSLVVGFFLQTVAIALDVSNDAMTSVDSLHSGRDFAQFVSLQCYILAVFLTAAEIKVRQSWQSLDTPVEAKVWPPAISPFSPARYRGWPIDEVRRSYRNAYWQSISWWKLPFVILATPLWPFAILAASLRQLWRNGSRAKAVSGRTYLAQLMDHLCIGITANLWPYHYYMFELFRADLRGRAYEYLRSTETKGALYKILRTDYSEPQRFCDKLLFYQTCERVGVRTVPIILALLDFDIIYRHPSLLLRLPCSDLFITSLSERGGTDTSIIKYMAGQYCAMDGRKMSEEQLVEELFLRSASGPLLVQPGLVNHPTLAGITVNTLSTVRVVTGTGLDGRGMVLAAALRFPSRAGSPIDKFRAGGIAAAIDLETGKLGQATDLGLSAKSAWHTRHPVTGRQIEGLRVPDWPAIVDLAKTAHNKLADRIILGWEIAPLADGPCIIAANAHPDLDICQRTMRAPLGNDRLGQLLAYHLMRLKDQR